MSQTGIARIENGTNQPNTKTLEKIMAAFDASDIEFIDRTGVKRRVDGIRTLRGQAGFWSFYDDVYQTVKAYGGDICISNNDEKSCDRWFGLEKWHEHKNRMIALSKTQEFHFRILAKEGDDYFTVPEFAEYRWSPKDRFSDVPFYVYGQKLAIFSYEEEDVSIFIIDNAKIAGAYKKQFSGMWDNAIEIPEHIIKAAGEPINDSSTNTATG